MFHVYAMIGPGLKRYIGITKNLSVRGQAHRYIARSGRKPRHPFYCAMRKAGAEKFRMEVIASFDDLAAARAEEVAIIARLKTVYPDGYNLSPGGDHDGGAGARVAVAMLSDPDYLQKRREVGRRTIAAARAKRRSKLRALERQADDLRRSIATWRKGEKWNEAVRELAEIENKIGQFLVPLAGPNGPTENKNSQHQ